jgi:phosphate uptake regulator
MIIRKTINEPSLLKYFDTTPYKLIIENEIVDGLELIGDALKRTARYARKLELDDMEPLAELLKNVFDHYLEIMTAHYKNDKEKLHELSCRKKEIMEKCNKVHDTIIKHVADTCIMQSNKKFEKCKKCIRPKLYSKLSLLVENIKAAANSTIYIAESSHIY